MEYRNTSPLEEVLQDITFKATTREEKRQISTIFGTFPSSYSYTLILQTSIQHVYHIHEQKSFDQRKMHSSFCLNTNSNKPCMYVNLETYA